MKLLLDESLPTQLNLAFGPNHEAFTVRQMNWQGKKNGELLGLMTLNGFDGLVTIDKNLSHQQNLSRFPLTIFVLNAPNNKLQILQPFVTQLITQLAHPVPTGLVVIELA